MAQVFAWGLRDSQGPPFAERSVRVFPLPTLSAAGLAPIASSSPDAIVAVWDPARDGLRKLSTGAPEPGTRLAELIVSAPPGDLAAGESWEVEVSLAPGVAPPTKLFVVGPGNAHAVPIPRQPPPKSNAGLRKLTLPFPEAFARSQAQLYDGEIFWWLEGRNAAGEIRSASAVRSLRVH